MTYNRPIIAITTVCAIAAVSCSKSEMENQTAGSLIPVNITASIETQTRASGTSFDEGDMIGMYAFRHLDDEEEAMMGVRQFDNTPLTISGGVPKTDAPLYFPKYEENTDFYMYYPYNDTPVEQGSTYQWMPAYEDQSSDAAFLASDKMVAKVLDVKKSPAPIHFQFKRLMSKIEFELTAGEGYTDESVEKAEVLLKNIKNSCALNLLTMEMESVSTPVDIIPHGTFSYDYWTWTISGVEAIIPPQKMEAGTNMFFISLGDKKFRGTIPEDIVFEAGKTYTFTVTLNRAINGDEVSVMPEINDWTDGGTLTGDVIEIEDPDDDISYVTDYDGNEYNIVTIGTQKWLGSNLRTTRFNDGTAISNFTDQADWDACESSEEPAWCYYNNDPAKEEKYGILYNWFAAAHGNICPEGWHVPTREEWNILVQFLGENGGTKLKATSGWYDIDGFTYPSYQGTDDYGFTAIPCGNRNGGNGEWFERIDQYCEWWSQDQDPTYSYSGTVYYLYSKYTDVKNIAHWKEFGHAIRCIKDN